MKIAIRGGRLVDPAQALDARCDVFIAAGKIAALGTAPPDWHANREIDATGLVVAPGLIDLAARLTRSRLDVELRAAVAGGITQVVCSPEASPVLDDPGQVDMLRLRAQSFHGPQVHPLGALSVGLAGQQLADLCKLRAAGCIGFSQGLATAVETRFLWRALQYAATFDYLVWLRPEDASLAGDGVAHDGEVAARLGLPGIPAEAELIAVATQLALARATGARLHLCRLSTAEGVELVRAAKAEGLRVTADVSALHLHLTEADIGDFDPQLRLAPPLRSQRDRDALRRGLLDGTVDAVVSDHFPHPPEAKARPFAEAAVGASGFETLLSLVLWLAQKERVALLDALGWVGYRAAAAAGLPIPTLSVGAPADVVVFDPTAYRLIRPSSFLSGGNSPLIGYELPGVIRFTLCRGHLAYDAAHPYPSGQAGLNTH
ncbi:MAG: dihydroorotase [Casimicrobiaceae bacterium]|nr:dihydroorotase [Casimicrobiaceae bacterium]